MPQFALFKAFVVAGLLVMASVSGAESAAPASLVPVVARANSSPDGVRPSPMVQVVHANLSRYGELGAMGTPGAVRTRAWRRMLEEARYMPELEQLRAVNEFFNREVRFTSDPDAWGRSDHWATPLEFLERGQGDCEDFAIAKYVSLLMLDFPASQLRLNYVWARFGSTASDSPAAHMVVSYHPEPASDPLILDSLMNAIRPASARRDLTPVFSFNGQGLWAPGPLELSRLDPLARLSRWRGVYQRMSAELIKLPGSVPANVGSRGPRGSRRALHKRS